MDCKSDNFDGDFKGLLKTIKVFVEKDYNVIKNNCQHFSEIIWDYHVNEDSELWSHIKFLDTYDKSWSI